MVRVSMPRAARPMKLFKLASCTAVDFVKPEMVAGVEPVVGVAVERMTEKVPVPVAPYKKFDVLQK
jgi:hypothetical protein